MEKIEDITEVPASFKLFYDSVEEWKAELKVLVENHEETDRLMVQMMKPMTSTQALEVRGKLKEISRNMNLVIATRFAKGKENGDKVSNGPLAGVGQMLHLTLIGSMIHRYSVTVMTTQEAMTLRASGLMGEMLTSN